MSHATHRLIGVLAVVLVAGALSGPAMASPGVDASGGDPVVRQAGGAPTTPENNSTHHENPDDVNEDGDVDQLTGWLNSRLAGQLGQSTIKLSQGEYEQARGVIGDDYNEMLSKYVDVAGDTAGSGDDEAAAEFEEAQAEQDAYVSAVADYRETRDAYLEAKANGNETRARELARNLSATADRIQQLSGNLTESYATIGSQTGASLDAEAAVVQNITQNVTEQQQAITEAEFIPTRLAVQGNQESISFTNPLRIQGAVTTENGTAVAGEPATILIGDRTYQVDPDEAGQFSLAYRPVRVPVAVDSLRVRYRPANESPYLGSNTTVPVDVAQTIPAVAVSVNTTTVAYGDMVRITGRVAANETAVPRVPVALTLGARHVGMVTTDSAGRFSTRVRIGANARPGTRSMTAMTGAEDQAIGRANATTQLRVVETPTRLRLDGAVVGERIVLQGRLLTADGRPVPEQSIELALTDQQTRSVTTNETGHFRTTIPSGIFDPGATVSITAAYHGASTNLESADAETAVVLPAQGFGRPTGWTPVLLGVGIVVALAAGGWVILRRRRAAAAAPLAADDVESGTSSGASTRVDTDGVRAAIRAAVALHRDGAAGAAIERVYPAVRQYLTRSYDLPETGTHWEFYHAVVENPATEAWTPVVRSLTEAYEQVRYAETAIDDATVEAVVTRLEERLDERASTTS